MTIAVSLTIKRTSRLRIYLTEHVKVAVPSLASIDHIDVHTLSQLPFDMINSFASTHMGWSNVDVQGETREFQPNFFSNVN